MTVESDVAGLYIRILGRTADPAGLANAVAAVNSGATDAQIALGLATSPEVQERVAGLYQAELGRPADGAGLANVTNYFANGGSLTQVEQSIAMGPEAQAAINRLYLTELGRSPDSGGTDSFTQYLAGGGSLTGVATSLAGSPEAQAQIGALYQQVLDRTPLPAERAAATRYLAGTGSLSGLRGGLATSNEAASDINSAYVAAGRTFPDAAPDSVRIDAGVSELLSGIPLTTLQREIADDVARAKALVPVSAQVSPVTPATLLGGKTPVFIYSLGTSDALIAVQPERVSFDYTYFGEVKSIVGSATVIGFNPATDILQISSRQAASFSDLTIFASNSSEGAGATVVTGAAITLLNVAPTSLHASNFSFV